MRGLEIAGLVVARGAKRVLHGVDLTVAPGEVVALVGANGAGKSSLVLAVAGALRPEAGQVRLAGRDLAGLYPDAVRRAGIAVVPEGHHVLGDLSVVDNLRAAGFGLGRRALEEELARALALFPELAPKLSARARDLSGGQKQMVALAQALIARPAILVIDELSLGLAPAVVKRLAGTVATIAEGGVGVLLIEQFTTVALALAARAYVLERGRVVFADTAAALQARPEVLHSAYLAAKPTPSISPDAA